MLRFKLRTLLLLLPLVANPAFAQVKSDPGEALYGEWEVVEMVYRGTVQDFGGKSGGFFLFEPGGFLRFQDADDRESIMRNKRLKNALMERCIVRPGEIDIWPKLLTKELEWLLKASCDLKGGKLRVIWGGDDDKRATDFDEAYKDKRLTLFVLKKVK